MRVIVRHLRIPKISIGFLIEWPLQIRKTQNLLVKDAK